jgi:hypothetical protein
MSSTPRSSPLLLNLPNLTLKIPIRMYPLCLEQIRRDRFGVFHPRGEVHRPEGIDHQTDSEQRGGKIAIGKERCSLLFPTPPVP